MLFQNIVGHKAIQQRFIAQHGNGRIPHAILLTGEDGAGALAFALALTQFLMCKDKQAEDACGICPSCVKNAKLTHPDVNYYFPIVKENKVESSIQVMPAWRENVLANPYITNKQWTETIGKEGKKGIITKKTAEELLSNIVLKPYEGSFRIQLIWHPETMQGEAANSLLKVLEEPPAKTIFILVCPDAEMLLSTIQSRVQITALPKLSVDEIAQMLMEHHNADESSAYAVAGIADGQIDIALSALSDDNWQFACFLEWARCTFKNNSSGLLDLASSLEKSSKDRQKQFFEYCLYIFRQALLFQYTGELSLTLRGNEKKWLTEKFYPFVNEKNIISLQSLFTDAIADVNRNVSFRLILLDVSYRTFRVLRPAKELA